MKTILNSLPFSINKRGSQSQELPIKIFFAFENNRAKSSNIILKKLQFIFQTISFKPLSKYLSINVVFKNGIIFFHFTAQDVEKIKFFQSRSYQINKIKISPSLLSSLRKNIFLSDQGQCQYGIDFITCYQDNANNTQTEFRTIKQCEEYPNKVIKTFIAIDGDIIQKIKKDYLFSDSFQEIIACHYWLINQTLKYIQTELTACFKIVLWSLFGLSFLISVSPGIFPKLNLALIWNNPFQIIKMIVTIVTLLLAKLPYFRQKLQAFLLPHIKSFIWQQIINPKSHLRCIAEFLLGRI